MCSVRARVWCVCMFVYFVKEHESLSTQMHELKCFTQHEIHFTSHYFFYVNWWICYYFLFLARDIAQDIVCTFCEYGCVCSCLNVFILRQQRAVHSYCSIRLQWGTQNSPASVHNLHYNSKYFMHSFAPSPLRVVLFTRCVSII